MWVVRCFGALGQTSGTREEHCEPELLEKNQPHLEIEIHFTVSDDFGLLQFLTGMVFSLLNIVDLH